MSSFTEPVRSGKSPLRAARLLDQVRERIRYLHCCLRTEQAYLLWVRARVRHHGVRHPRELGGPEVEAFLNTLVNERSVSASTHKQALCALIFLYRKVLDPDLPWMQQTRPPAVRKHVPAVLTVEQGRDVLGRMQGETALVARVLYGCGLRLTAAPTWRAMDLDSDRQAIVVRGGKGRVVMLPRSLVPDLRAQLSRTRAWWDQDRRPDRPGVAMPDALARKYPSGSASWGWHRVFRADRCSPDPRSEVVRRHHLYPQLVQRHLERAVAAAGISLPVSVHTLRHSFATHVLKYAAGTVANPLDALAPSPGPAR